MKIYRILWPSGSSKTIESMELSSTYFSFGPTTLGLSWDFNEIVTLSENFGGSGWKMGLMEAFQNTFVSCGLSDLGYSGPKFTWSNGKEGNKFSNKGLDRAVANYSWCGLYPEVEVTVGTTLWLDHSQIFLLLKGTGHNMPKQRLLYYEAGWSLDQKCRDIIDQK